jgi:hypothetical protein
MSLVCFCLLLPFFAFPVLIPLKVFDFPQHSLVVC